MHNRDELCLEPGLDIMGDMCNGGSNGISDCECGVYDDTKAFDLKVSLVQGFKGTSIVEVMVK